MLIAMSTCLPNQRLRARREAGKRLNALHSERRPRVNELAVFRIPKQVNGKSALTAKEYCIYSCLHARNACGARGCTARRLITLSSGF